MSHAKHVPTRLGAFEVYVLTNAPADSRVDSVVAVHSKLWSRRWPSMPMLTKRVQAALAPLLADKAISSAAAAGEAAPLRAALTKYGAIAGGSRAVQRGQTLLSNLDARSQAAARGSRIGDEGALARLSLSVAAVPAFLAASMLNFG